MMRDDIDTKMQHFRTIGGSLKVRRLKNGEEDFVELVELYLFIPSFS